MEAISFLIFALWYFLPSLIAKHRSKKNIGVVVTVNLFFGWTIIGWFIAFAMAFGETE